MEFSELLQAVRSTPAQVLIPAQWAQGRASFGGLLAGLLHEAMTAHIAPERFVRSLAITFVGPAAPDVPISFEVEILREGKAVSQVLGRAVQNGEVVTLMQGSFGADRDSVINVAADPPPHVKGPEAYQSLPFISGLVPEFTRYMDMRWAIGGLPFSGHASREMGGWVRLRNQEQIEALNISHLLALVDAWPPALLPHLRKPAAGSSLTWTIEFIQPQPALNTANWCLYRAFIEHARAGYGHVAAQVWSEEGELLAISRQTVTVFA